MKKDGRFIMIMIIHVLVIWSFSVWSYSGTATGIAFRSFFNFASGAIDPITELNLPAVLLSLSLLFIGIPCTVFLFKHKY